MRFLLPSDRPVLRSAGFTIIEVMIVLVIAAVILLIVFLAVPALQRNSRNTQRNQAAARIGSTFLEWLGEGNTLPGNNMGANQSVANDLRSRANADIFTKLEITSTDISMLAETGPQPSNRGYVQIRIGRVCNESGTNIATGTGISGRYAIVYWLEPDISRCIEVR